MTYLELRRHSTRVPGTIHLSQEGVTLARRVGEGMGPFARVLSSPSPWAYETAIAMGFAVDERYEPVPLDDAEWLALHHLMPPGTPFSERARVMREDPLGRRLAAMLRQQWQSYASALAEGTAALVLTHGGYIDSSAAACLPNADHAAWGDNFGHCEGIRLTFGTTRFTGDAVSRPSSGRID